MFRLTSHTAVPELCFPEALFLWWRSTTLRWHCFHRRCCDSRLFAFLLPRHLSTGRIYSPAILWDVALLHWDLSCLPMVTMGASASASNCSLSSRSRYPWLGQIKSHEWMSGTASRRGLGSPVPWIFCTDHEEKALKDQLLQVILLLFRQCSPLSSHLFPAAGACPEISLYLHSMASPGTKQLWLKSTLLSGESLEWICLCFIWQWLAFR